MGPGPLELEFNDDLSKVWKYLCAIVRLFNAVKSKKNVYCQNKILKFNISVLLSKVLIALFIYGAN